MHQRKDKHVSHTLKLAQMGQRPKHKTIQLWEENENAASWVWWWIFRQQHQQHNPLKKKKTLTNETLSKFKTFVLYLKRHY